MVLAHGAGAGQRHPFVDGLRRRLGHAGLPTMTFDFPYMEAGRRFPDRLETLMACSKAAAERLAAYADPVVLAGKSMGGRVATHVAADGIGAAVVVYGYPLVPLGGDEPRSTDHFPAIGVPVLILQGERDRMGPEPLLRRAADRLADGRLVVVDDADHGFGVPKRTGLSADDVLDRLADETVRFVLGQVRGGGV